MTNKGPEILESQEILLPPETHATHLWTVRRRWALLISLVIGLGVFFLWLPGGARTALFAALGTQRVLVGMIFLFALIALSLVWSVGQRLDTWIFLLFNLRSYRAKWLDRVMWLATQLGNVVTAFILAGLLFVLNEGSLAAVVILGTLTLWLVVETIKVLTDRARPFLDLKQARVIGWRERGRSFPSGHTAQTFFLMTVLASTTFSHGFQPGVGGTIALYAVAVLVGFTRMYVGAHYPRDVIGGAVLGSVWGILATLVDPYWFWRF
jgi:membrane-associated phospholipid phosphatase